MAVDALEMDFLHRFTLMRRDPHPENDAEKQAAGMALLICGRFLSPSVGKATIQALNKIVEAVKDCQHQRKQKEHELDTHATTDCVVTTKLVNTCLLEVVSPPVCSWAGNSAATWDCM